ncbi:MAG: sigma-54 dependent transcriptional regulator [Calditerrivibrio sp.]|nr:sigma-54 dependent transcriptional regulator [Calditerrivibrio sp.]
MPTILIVDDEKSFREVLEILFTAEGFSVLLAKNISEAKNILDRFEVDIVLSDLVIGKESGLDLARYAKDKNMSIPFLLITAYASPDTAMESVKLGVIDYISKPFDNDKLIKIVKDLVQKDNEDETIEELNDIIGNSPFIKDLKKKIKDIAKGDSSVLITGESGTGKELVARAIHNLSNRKVAPFVPINCGAIPSELVEAELFGYKKGAFTGAYTDKRGLFEIASGGTVFLDEITELPLNLQVKLLRVLQDKKVMKVGSTEELPIDIRVISATNKNIALEVEKGNFRSDLYYRINVVNIDLKPLRERVEDIEPLSRFFLKKFSEKMNKSVKEISYPVLEILKSYDYKGNVRELQNIIERGVALEKSDRLLPASILEYFSQKTTEHSPLLPELRLDAPINLEKIVDSIEKRYISCALQLTGHNQSKSAKLLGISLRMLRYKMDKHGLT